MLQRGTKTHTYFHQASPNQYTLKSVEEYAKETGTPTAVTKKYFRGSTLEEIFELYPFKKNMNTEDRQKGALRAGATRTMPNRVLRLGQRWRSAGFCCTS
jgi:hypothetical protein